MMRAMGSGALGLRASALLGVGALALHQGRYLVGYGDDAGRALAVHGHSYLTVATTLVVLACVVALGGFLATIARGDVKRRAAPALWRVAAVAAGALLAIYCMQEVLEGIVAAGHPSGAAGVWGAGGWSAVPLAAAVGMVIALLLRGAEAVLARLADRRAGGRPRPAAIALRPSPRVAVVRPAGLARHLASRAPPLIRL